MLKEIGLEPRPNIISNNLGRPLGHCHVFPKNDLGNKGVLGRRGTNTPTKLGHRSRWPGKVKRSRTRDTTTGWSYVAATPDISRHAGLSQLSVMSFSHKEGSHFSWVSKSRGPPLRKQNRSQCRRCKTLNEIVIGVRGACSRESPLQVFRPEGLRLGMCSGGFVP